MHSLGHPRRVLVGLRFDDDLLPLAGAQVFNAADEAAVIGAVTSSAVSPVLGNKTIALAVVKWGKHTSGSAVVVPAEGRMAGAAVVELGAISDVVQ
jgi:glycine cleavage system aminomethyltransferase T